jgi:hypothetical protein
MAAGKSNLTAACRAHAATLQQLAAVRDSRG